MSAPASASSADPPQGDTPGAAATEPEAAPVVVAFKKRGGKKKKGSKRSRNLRKRKRSNEGSGDGDDVDAADPSTMVGEVAAKRAKKTREAGRLTAKTSASMVSAAELETRRGVSYASSMTAAPSGPRDAGATRHADGHMQDSDEDSDTNVNKAEVGTADGVYRGAANRASFVEKRESMLPSAIGPMKRTSHIRETTLFDYQPNICKDWKETGYCGYGASCKFLHDRSDYKSGWEQEKEWEDMQKRKRLKAMRKQMERAAGGKVSDDSSSSSDSGSSSGAGLPFACFICRKAFTDPVVTLCGHYFCESCALARHKKKKRCSACNKPTNGVFNKAHKLIRHLDRKKAQGVDLNDLAARQGGDSSSSSSSSSS